MQGREGRRIAARTVGGPEPGPIGPHVPVGEVVDHEIDDRPGPRGDVVPLPRGSHGADSIVEAAQNPTVGAFQGLGPGARGLGCPVAGIHREKAVRVLERVQEPPHRLGDRLEVEPLRQPDLARREQVEPRGVGAVLVDHLPRVDHVPLRLRHLLALGVQDQLVDDHVLVRRPVEHRRRDGQERVKPATGLVDPFADVIRDRVRLELLGVLERIVPLCHRHRARVEPGIDHLGGALHRATAGTRPAPRIDERLVRVEAGGALLPGRLLQRLVAPDHGDVLLVLVAHPDRERCTPIPVTREGPVDIVLEPATEAAVADLLGMPVHLLVDLEHPRLDRGGPDEPGVLGEIDQLAGAAPAMRVRMLVLLGEEVPSLGLEPPDDELVGLVGGDQLPLELGPGGALEGAIGRHGADHREVVELPRSVVVRTESGGHVYDARAVLRGDERSGDDDGVPPRLGIGHDIERPRVAEPDQLLPLHPTDARRFGDRLPLQLDGPGTGIGNDQLLATHLIHAVVELRIDRRRHVARQGPGRRGPHHQLPPRAVGQRKSDVDALVSDVFIPEGQFVARERGTAAGAVRQHPVPAIEQLLLVQLGEQPPDRLDVLVGVGDIGRVVVEPVTGALGELLPVALVLEDALAAEGVELLDAIGLDVLLPLEAELLLDLELDREAVGVPPRLPGDLPPLGDAEPADEVLDGAAEDVVDPRAAVGRGRTFEEDERRAPGARPLHLLEELLLLPRAEDVVLERGGRGGPDRELAHAGHTLRLRTSSVCGSLRSTWSWARTCALACNPSTSPS